MATNHKSDLLLTQSPPSYQDSQDDREAAPLIHSAHNVDTLWDFGNETKGKERASNEEVAPAVLLQSLAGTSGNEGETAIVSRRETLNITLT